MTRTRNGPGSGAVAPSPADPGAAACAAFARIHGQNPAFLICAPGRVNLIGEHTDYNDGFVLPLAIDRHVWIALRARPDRRVRVTSLDFGDAVEFDLGRVERGPDGWGEYFKGVGRALAESTPGLKGWEGVVAGDVPRGAGLSSSAAVELAAARAFAAAHELHWDPLAAALLGQRVENEWIGVKCGIMDQLVVAAGVRGHALLIDCRTLERTPVPLPEAAAVIVLDTATRRGLVDSAYNERRAQCEAAARHFGVPALRDVDAAAWQAGSDRLDPVTRRRARHVTTENARTLEAAAALRAGNLARVGRLMDESHASLARDFEVSSLELDLMVGIARSHGGCLGARMTGAGFGGCAVALVAADEAAAFVDYVAPAYEAATGLAPAVYLCRAEDGVRLARAPITTSA